MKNKYQNPQVFYKDILHCPKCHKIHIDKGVWAKRLHHKHLCLHCNHIWELKEFVFGIDPDEIEQN